MSSSRWLEILLSEIEWYLGESVSTWRKLSRRFNDLAPAYVRPRPTPKIHLFVDASLRSERSEIEKLVEELLDVAERRGATTYIYQWANGILTDEETGEPLVYEIRPGEAREVEVRVARVEAEKTSLSPALEYAIGKNLIESADVVVVVSNFNLEDPDEAADVLRDIASSTKMVLVAPESMERNVNKLDVENAVVITM